MKLLLRLHLYFVQIIHLTIPHLYSYVPLQQLKHDHKVYDYRPQVVKAGQVQQKLKIKRILLKTLNQHQGFGLP